MINRYIKTSIQILAVACTVMGVFLSIGSILLEEQSLYAHLFVHFQLQFWILTLIGALLIPFVFNRWLVIPPSIYLLLAYIFILHPVSLFSFSTLTKPDLFYINAHYSNEQPEVLAEYIKETSPKIAAIVESSPPVVSAVDDVRSDQILNHRAYASSCTIYSKMGDAEVENLTHLPICRVRYEDFDLLVVHAHRPLGEANLEENLEFFDTIKAEIDLLEQEGRGFILVGDFNSSNYSKYFRERFGDYVTTNRYTWMMHTPAMLPIDHAMSNMDIRVKQKRIKGSDHSALLIEFK